MALSTSGFPAHVAPGAGQAGVDAGAGVPAEASAEQALHAPRCRIQLLPLQNVPQRHHHLRVVEGLVLGGLQKLALGPTSLAEPVTQQGWCLDARVGGDLRRAADANEEGAGVGGASEAMQR